jgi:peptidoglycan hydrolase CwlO-like protein
MSLFFKKKTGVWLLGGALSLALCGTAARANVLGDIGHSISSLWAQKARKQEAARTARSKASAQSQQVQFLHDRLIKTQSLLQSANERYSNYFRQMRRTEAQILDTREKADDLNDRYDEHKHLFGQRLASMQKHGQTNFLQVALGSVSLADLTRRTAFFQAVAKRDTDLQNQLKADKQELIQSQNDLMAQWNNRNKLQKEANQERERIAQGEAEQSQTWSQLNSSRLALINYSLEQERSSEQINGMIGSLQSRRARALAEYQAQARRERAQLRAQTVYRYRVRRRVVRYYAPRHYYSRRTYAVAKNYGPDHSFKPVRSGHYNLSNYSSIAKLRYPTSKYKYSYARSNLAKRNGLKYAPRVDLTPQYAPRIELAPMPIQALQNPGG